MSSVVIVDVPKPRAKLGLQRLKGLLQPTKHGLAKSALSLSGFATALLYCHVASSQVLATEAPDPARHCKSPFGLSALTSELAESKMLTISTAEAKPVFKSAPERATFSAAERAEDVGRAEQLTAAFKGAFANETAFRTLKLSLMHRYIALGQMDKALDTAIQVASMPGTSLDALATGALLYAYESANGPVRTASHEVAFDFGSKILFAENSSLPNLSDSQRAARSVAFVSIGIRSLESCEMSIAKNDFEMARDITANQSMSFYVQLATVYESFKKYDAALASLEEASKLAYAAKHYDVYTFGEYDPELVSFATSIKEKIAKVAGKPGNREHTTAMQISSPISDPATLHSDTKIAAAATRPAFKIRIVRDYREASGIYGHIDIPGERIFTLERDDTFLPDDTFSGVMNYYSPSGHVIDGDFLIQLSGVPRHEGVQIHIGNASFQSHGCILVGTGIGSVKVFSPRLNQFVVTSGVVNSRNALEKLRVAFYGSPNPKFSPNTSISVEISKATDYRDLELEVPDSPRPQPVPSTTTIPPAAPPQHPAAAAPMPMPARLPSGRVTSDDSRFNRPERAERAAPAAAPKTVERAAPAAAPKTVERAAPAERSKAEAKETQTQKSDIPPVDIGHPR